MTDQILLGPAEHIVPGRIHRDGGAIKPGDHHNIGGKLPKQVAVGGTLGDLAFQRHGQFLQALLGVAAFQRHPGAVSHIAHESKLFIGPIARHVLLHDDDGNKNAVFENRQVNHRADADRLPGSGHGTRVRFGIGEHHRFLAPQFLDKRAKIAKAVGACQAGHIFCGTIVWDRHAIPRRVDSTVGGAAGIQGAQQNARRGERHRARVIHIA